MKACLPEEPKPAKAEGDEANKKTKKVKSKKPETEEEVEWSEDTSNNPFADLLKDLNIKEESRRNQNASDFCPRCFFVYKTILSAYKFVCAYSIYTTI